MVPPRKPTDDFAYIIPFLAFFLWSRFSIYAMWPHLKEPPAHTSLLLIKSYFIWRHQPLPLFAKVSVFAPSFAQSSYSICRITESLVPLQHTGILPLFFSHCSSSHVHVVHHLSSSIHLRLESLIDRNGILAQSSVKYSVCFQNVC